MFLRLDLRHVLRDVQTLILDGLAVPAELVAGILGSDKFNVRILSVREAKHLNERKLMQALQYAVRSSRPVGQLKLKGLYIFGKKDKPAVRRFRRSVVQHTMDIPFDETAVSSVRNSVSATQMGAQWSSSSLDVLPNPLDDRDENWYGKLGKVIRKPIPGWEAILELCQGLIAFDAVLCNGPRHTTYMNSMDPGIPAHWRPWYEETSAFLSPAVATHSLGGCASCGSAPEGRSVFGESPAHQFPLLAPPSLHSSTVKAGITPPSNGADPPKLLARCEDCISGRHCTSCNIWWCEDCYNQQGSNLGARFSIEVKESGLDTAGVVVEASERFKKTAKVHSGLCVEKCLIRETTAFWKSAVEIYRTNPSGC